MEFDHLAICARSLEEGADWVAHRLGVAPGPGGAHPAMGTHNRLLSLGPGAYLEVIAIDPGAAPPGHARWFGLDGWTGAPGLGAWVARVPDLRAALSEAAGWGAPMDLSRGDLTWRMAVGEGSRLPFDGAAPALIEWGPAGGAAERLPDQGVRLAGLTVSHPAISALAAVMPPPDGVTYEEGPPALSAEIATPEGRVRL